MYLFRGLFIRESIFSVSLKIESSIFNDTVFMIYLINITNVYPNSIYSKKINIYFASFSSCGTILALTQPYKRHAKHWSS